MGEMKEMMDLVANDPNVKATVLMSGKHITIERINDYRSTISVLGKPGCFIAGADIVMLQKCKSSEEASQLSKGMKHCGIGISSNIQLRWCLLTCTSLPGLVNGSGKKQKTLCCCHHGLLPWWWA